MTERVIAVVTAGLTTPSSSRLLADQLTAAVQDELSARGQTSRSEVIEVRDHAHDLTNNLLTGFPSGDLARAIDSLVKSDAVIAVTPIFSASYSGLFKTFFDVLEADSLAGKPVLVAATAGTARHSLALEFALRPLFAYLKAVVVPTAVFAATEDFGAQDGGSSPLGQRVDRAARELADLVVGRSASGPVDPFENPTPFADLLAGR